MSEPYKTLLLQREDGVDWLTLNRPQRLNALTETMVQELNSYFRGLAHDTSCRVVVLRGAGKGFCAGLDIFEATREGGDGVKGADGADTLRPSLLDVVRAMRDCPQPIVALLHGAASGGGFGLALAADIRLADSTARMNAAMVKLGLSGCEMGISYFLPRLVGAGIAAELMYTGRFIDAARAEKLGLVSAVAAPEALDALARSFTQDMLAATPLGLRRTKETLKHCLGVGDLETVLKLEELVQLKLVKLGHDERLRAFTARREPAASS